MDDEIIPIIDEIDDSPAPAFAAGEERPATGALSLRPITSEEARVLGCLIEKEATTPDYYPLTLNSLVTACNQSTNRDPVVSYSEGVVEAALEGLKSRRMVLQLTQAGARVQKFKHDIRGKFPALERPQAALLCVLLLRGPQTVGELRQRSERIYAFPDMGSVESTLDSLVNFIEGPLVVSFPPGPGRKATLFGHTLCGVTEAPAGESPRAAVVSTAPTLAGLQEEWKSQVEAELAALRAEVTKLKEALGVE
jgi:uncharacterized protein